MVSRSEVETRAPTAGIYLYGVAARPVEYRLGPVGIGAAEVYTVPFRDLCAIMHDCPAEPYRFDDEETTRSRVRAHQAVLEEARRRFGTVIPAGFNTILDRDAAGREQDAAVSWLSRDYERLYALARRLEGKDEYCVRVYCDHRTLVEQVVRESGEVRQIKEEISRLPPGAAYLSRQRLERAIRAGAEQALARRYNDFFGRINGWCSAAVIDKTRRDEGGRVTLMNLSCLVERGKVEGLGDELGKINTLEGVSVHFSGPWPPYTFAAQPGGVC